MKHFIGRLKKSFVYGEKGFTLIELLIVIAVLGALASVVVPNVSNFMKSANVAAANSEIANVKTAALSYIADNGAFPSTSDNLTVAGGGAADLLSGQPKAKYTFNPSTGLVTQVDSVANGWTGIVFSISQQKWITGVDDGNAANGNLGIP